MKRRRRTKKYALKTVVLSGKTFVCQGYEPFVLKRLIKKFGVKDVVSQFDKDFQDIHGGRTWYRPDFYIRSRRTYVEVKSTWTLLGKNSYFKKCVRKAKAAVATNKKVVMLIAFPNRKLIIKLPDDWYAQTRLAVQTWLESRVK